MKIAEAYWFCGQIYLLNLSTKDSTYWLCDQMLSTEDSTSVMWANAIFIFLKQYILPNRKNGSRMEVE